MEAGFVSPSFQSTLGLLPPTSSEPCVLWSLELLPGFVFLYSHGRVGAGWSLLLWTAFIRILPVIKLLPCVCPVRFLQSTQTQAHLRLTKWWTGTVFAQEV